MFISGDMLYVLLSSLRASARRNASPTDEIRSILYMVGGYSTLGVVIRASHRHHRCFRLVSRQSGAQLFKFISKPVDKCQFSMLVAEGRRPSLQSQTQEPWSRTFFNSVPWSMNARLILSLQDSQSSELFFSLVVSRSRTDAQRLPTTV